MLKVPLHPILLTRSLMFATVGACCLSSSRVYADIVVPSQSQLPVGAGKALPTPPPRIIPTDLDEAGVQDILGRIEEPGATSKLKIGIFSRRASSMSPTAGYELIVQAIQKEQVGSARWFFLKSLEAYAGLNTSTVSSEDAIGMYGELFDQSKEAANVKALYPLHQAIAEYVMMVPTLIRNRGLQDASITQEVLGKAWLAYYSTLEQKQQAKVITQVPNWGQTLAKLKDPEALLPVVERSLQDPATPKDFDFYLAAAGLYAQRKPDKALSLLQEAKPLLPPALERTAPYYALLSRLFQSNNQLGEAILAQNQVVQSTGQGRTRLLQLFVKNHDEVGVSRLLDQLSQTDANTSEILSIADAVLSPGKPDPTLSHAEDEADNILKAYLSTTRQRDPIDELQARYLLGRDLAKKDRILEATAILQVAAELPPSSPGLTAGRGRFYQKLIKQLLQRMSAPHGPTELPSKQKIDG